MPQINTPTTEDSDLIYTSYEGTASTTTQNFSFSQTQNGMTFWNRGDTVLTVTVGEKKHNVPSKSTITIDDQRFLSFDVQSSFGSQRFGLRSFSRKSSGEVSREDIVNIDTKLSATDKNVTDLTTQLAQKATKEEVEIERARISNLTANAGDTDGNAELLDIRVGFDGITYTTAGDATRALSNYMTEQNESWVI